MNGKKIVMIAVAAVIVITLFLSVRDVFLGRGDYAPNKSSSQGGGLALIYVEGEISGGRSQGAGIMTVSGGMDHVLEQLRDARLNPSVEAVVLRVNSPGGTASATQEIHSEILKLREDGKVVVVSMSDMAASGGYYISVAADHIMANPGTTTGSIGVILQHISLEELFEELGIEFETIKSGEFKDIGDISRAMTSEEREILQSFSQDVYEQFVEAVASGRNMSKEQVLALADGRVFTGRQALELGLVDELGNIYDAVDRAAELAGMEGAPNIIGHGGITFWDIFFGSSINSPIDSRNFLEHLYFYRWNRGVEIR
ncbi:signal peptide peptidase SppA [Candidatus Contubernalis alkaliaceticus]|uniref:signal peptide peptidase SppA n=1 Tax=Candidatus Contubernalis alkaliaceticus TaxID=338645 RepID=UPI001F4BD8EB|nr:signal peptide peptidase SppA [Candidatus Contubernalis alkalaceticus]UNC93693.1 signal peptide peptidase SppA [Candidatus Contubernalis alkalaceticus]